MVKKQDKIDSFHEFLLEKKKEEKNEMEWEERKEKWLHSISSLYADIKKWMAPFQKEGLIKISDEREVNITEEYLGKYSAKRLDLYFGNDIISLVPKGTLIYGFYGRLDMSGPKGEIMILEPKWDNWEFGKATPKLERWNFTKESFKDIIKDLV